MANKLAGWLPGWLVCATRLTGEAWLTARCDAGGLGLITGSEPISYWVGERGKSVWSYVRLGTRSIAHGIVGGDTARLSNDGSN